MSCAQADGAVRSEAIHRSHRTRFLRRPQWQKNDFNAPLREALLQMEAGIRGLPRDARMLHPSAIAASTACRTIQRYCLQPVNLEIRA
jgi:hypothetical protein